MSTSEEVMAAMESRDPTDYEEWQDERKLLMGIIRKQTGGGHGSVHETKWSTWILGIVGVLIAAGVLGLTSAMFTMTGRLASLETKVDMLVDARK